MALLLLFTCITILLILEFNELIQASVVPGISCNGYLGVGYITKDNVERLPDDSLSASSERHYCHAKYGRLYYPVKRKEFGVWCPVDDDPSPWFQVDFGKMTTVRKVTLGTNVDLYQYVKSYTVSYRYRQSPWFMVNDTAGNVITFPGMPDVYTQKTVDLGSYITAQYFRIHPKTKSDNYCMQLELHGCFPGKDATVAVGVANSSIIHDNQMSASSERKNHFAHDARLNNKPHLPRQWGAWCANDEDMSPWLQVDLKTVREISAISTRGHPFVHYDAWTTQYKVNYSKNGISWRSYNDGQIIPGNIDADSVVMNKLKPTFFARYVKLMPKEWNNQDSGMPCLRIEIYERVSRKEAIPSLIKGLTDITINRGEELMLECAFRGQPLIQVAWQKNGDYLSSDNKPIHIETSKNITALLEFQRVTAADNAVFSCLAWYPGLHDIFTKSGCVVTVLSPIPILNVVNISNIFVFVNISYIEPLTKDIRGFVLRVKHSELPSFNVIISIDAKELNRTQYMVYKLQKLRPYSRYVLDIGMLYIGDEIGDITSARNVFTLQDVPYGEPLNFVVERLSPESLGCSWSLPNITLRNGPIIGYEVRYIKSAEEGEIDIEVAEFKYLNKTRTTLYNLEAGAIYQVTVRAFTNIGPGPYVFPATLCFTGKSTAELNEINKMLITKKNAASVSQRLQNITSDRKNLNKHDVELTIDILEKVVSVENTTDIGESLINTVSNIMKANKTVLEESEMTNRTGTRYIKVLEKWLEGVDPKDKALQENSENVIVKKVYWHLGLLEEEIRFAEEEEAAEIIIPTKIFRKQNKTEDVSIYFVFYKNNKFFRNSTVLETNCVNGFTVTKERTYTPVISGDIVGTDTHNLSEPIVLKFKMNTNASLEDSACVYWDFKADNEKGNWSTKGCTVHSIIGQTIECHCNHLTNFAALMDVYSYTSKVCGHHQAVISYITVFGCFLSLIGLFITFLTYCMFKSLHQELSAKVLVQLCVSLFIVVLTFIIGIQEVKRPAICAAVAIILHYFTLVSFLWMMIEAVLMYYSFVKVWPPREGGDIYKSSIAAWGIPLVIVASTYLTSRDDYGGQHYCHVTGVPLYATYLAPMGIVIVANFVLFICIMHGLSTRPDNNVDRTHLERALIRCRRAFGIMILMGLTWSFGFGLASNARLEFSYLFAITNGLQGFAIFMFYCVSQKNARRAWKRFFTCDRRAKHERNTESYCERLRLSSAASTATQLRVNSDASTLHRFNNKYDAPGNITSSPVQLTYHNELLAVPELRHHVVTPPRSPRSPKIAPMPTINQDTVLGDGDNFRMSIPAEDEILDMRLQGEISDVPKPLKPKMELKKYSSYRALSGPATFDVFSLVKTPSAKSLHRDSHHRKSAEFINRKGEKSRLNRSSMIESSSLSSNHKQKMRGAKSMEQVNKKESFCDSNANNISMLDIGSHRDSIFKQEDSIPDQSTDEKTLGTGTDSDTLGPTQETYPVNVGTMKSDATTMTDMNELAANGLVHNPLYGFKGDTQRSPSDIMQWLHEGNDPSKSDASDSDYSSTYYKTSRSSSMTDMHGPLRSSASECSRTNKKKTREKELLDNMVLAPLMGTRNNSNSNHRKRLSSKRYSQRSSGKSDDSEDRSELSEAGYSASEEDLVDKGLFVNRTKSRRRKTRRRSTNLSKNSQYVTLEEPSSHVSFV